MRITLSSPPHYVPVPATKPVAGETHITCPVCVTGLAYTESDLSYVPSGDLWMGEEPGITCLYCGSWFPDHRRQLRRREHGREALPDH